MADGMSTPSGDVVDAIEQAIFPDGPAAVEEEALDQEEVAADSEDTPDDQSDSAEGRPARRARGVS